jgi:predicted AAA+ superfamily ATPase
MDWTILQYWLKCHMRYLSPCLLQDLGSKMVFVGGPRQVGKTTMAMEILKRFPTGRYFNWDFDEDRQDILKMRWTAENALKESHPTGGPPETTVRPGKYSGPGPVYLF